MNRNTDSFLAVSRGLGRHVWAGPPDAQYAWAVGLFIAELGYFVTIACVKWSILAFYYRSFKIRSSVKLPIFTLAVIVLMWAVGVVSIQLRRLFKKKSTTCLLTHLSLTDPRYNFAMPTHQCVVGAIQPNAPITTRGLQMHSRLGQVFLRKCNPDNCYRYFDIAVASSVHHDATTSQRAKVGSCWYFLRWALVSRQYIIFFVFSITSIGKSNYMASVTIVSIVRLHYLLQGNLTSPDITWNFVNIALWSVVEGNTAIFCGKHVPSSRDLPSLWVIFSDSLSLPPACLPFLRPVLSKFSFGIFSLSSVPSKKQPSSGTRGTLRMSYYQKDGARPWQGDGRFVTTTSHSRAYSHAHETDEHPFAHLTDDGSERSIPVKEGQDDSQIELDNVSPPRGPIEPNGIVVTREFHLQHQEAQHQDV